MSPLITTASAIQVQTFLAYVVLACLSKSTYLQYRLSSLLLALTLRACYILLNINLYLSVLYSFYRPLSLNYQCFYCINIS